jgi:hypothetical protein
VWRERGDRQTRVLGRLTGKFDVDESAIETAAAESVNEIVVLAERWLRRFEAATESGAPTSDSP